MFIPSHQKLRTLVLLMITILGFHGVALAQEGRISGKVSSLADKDTVDGATVLAYQLSTEKVFRSTPTDSGGKFMIQDLATGYYDLAIETTEGLFVANQIVNVSPAGKVVINIDLSPAGADLPGQTAIRAYPGAEDPAVGVMQISERLTGTRFWKTPKGVVILSTVGGAALLAIAVTSKDDNDPVTP